MKRNYLIYGTLFCLALFSNEELVGQERPSRRHRAEMYFDKLEYANAVKVYERLVDTKRPRIEDMEKLVESYPYLNRYDLAENWYDRVVVENGARQQAQLNYANALKQQGKYAEEKKQYEMYMSKYGRSPEIERQILGADSAIVWMENPTNYKLLNAEAINTPRAEFGAIAFGDGVIYAGEPTGLVSKRSGMTGESYLRVYAGTVDEHRQITGGQVYKHAFNSSAYHVGPLATNTAEDVLYVTRTYDGKDAERFRKGGTKWRKQNLKLKIYRQSGDSWVEEDFPYNDVERYSLGHATLSSDGRTLYYASDMPGGYGGVDIWYSELQTDGSWGAPQNAGPEINTSGDEMFPNVHGNSLYFSSNGHIGMGGLDIFRAEGSKSDFSIPQNLGHPVNSAADDFSFFVSSNIEGNLSGYLSSNRQGGVGSDDIYSFNYERPRITIILEGVTRNKDNGELLAGSDVTLFGENDAIVAKVLSGKNGDFRFDVEANTPYRIYGEKQGFFPDSLALTGINAGQDTTIRITLNLQPVFTVGDKFVLENIYYDFDKHNSR